MNRTIIAIAVVAAAVLGVGAATVASTARQPVADLEYTTAKAGDSYYRIVRDQGLTCTGLELFAANGRAPLDPGTIVFIPPSCRTVPTTSMSVPTTTVAPSTTTAPTTTVRPTTTTSTTTTTLPPIPATTVPAEMQHPGIFVDRDRIPAAQQGFDFPIIEPATYTPRRSHDGVGAWRTNCSFSHMAFDDPIVYPGRPGASHLHAFFGATGVDANTTDPTMEDASTCNGGTVNRSAYWSPAIIDTRTGTPVVPPGEHALQVYYKTGYRGVRNEDITVPPAGLRMIAGNVNKERLDGNTWGPVKYHCLSAVAFNNSNAYTESFPNCQPGDSLVMTIDFPQCWNGRDLDSPDHKWQRTVHATTERA